MNYSGIRDTVRVLHFNINAVVRTLKNSRRDMGNKKQQCWLWYALELHLNVLLLMLLVAEEENFGQVNDTFIGA